MIDENLLSELKSHINDPVYSILITDVTSEIKCNQETLTFTIHQVDDIGKSEIEKDKVVTEKKFTVVSSLDVNDNSLYYSKLNGFFSDEKIIKEVPKENRFLSNTIEILETTLKEEVSIEFNKEYTQAPKIFVNIEEKFESLYRSFSLNFKTKKDKNNETVYKGVDITFRNLKSKREYPKISIICISEHTKTEEGAQE